MSRVYRHDVWFVKVISTGFPCDSAGVIWRSMAEGYRIGDAAELLGVRVETIRRWEKAGTIRLRRTKGGQRLVPAAEVARLLAAKRPRQQPIVAGSARNRFAGVITEVKKDGVAATVEIVA